MTKEFGLYISIHVPDNWEDDDVEKYFNEHIKDFTIWELEELVS